VNVSSFIPLSPDVSVQSHGNTLTRTASLAEAVLSRRILAPFTSARSTTRDDRTHSPGLSGLLIGERRERAIETLQVQENDRARRDRHITELFQPFSVQLNGVGVPKEVPKAK
jgi:hypothetical protein